MGLSAFLDCGDLENVYSPHSSRQNGGIGGFLIDRQIHE